MQSSEIVHHTITTLAKDRQMDRPASLALLRNLRHLPECEFYAHDGNDHMIVRHDNRYVFVVMSNIVLPAPTGVGYTGVPSGDGDVVVLRYHDSKKEAMEDFREVFRIDNNLYA